MRRATFLPFSPPTLGDDECAAVLETLRSDWLTTGPRTAAFEREFAQFVDAEAAVALSSCTAGLQLALTALDVGPGDCVVTSTLTFPGTVNAIEHTGATPLLVDVDPDTLDLTAAGVEAALAEAPGRPRVILPVHYGGAPCDVDALLDVAARRDLAVVEDAAHALPTRWRGRRIGAWCPETDARHPPRLTSFSFYANKNLTTAEGGMVTGPSALVDRVKTLSRHGLSRSRDANGHGWDYDVREPGHKANMTDVQAALGRVQLGRLPGFHARRTEIARAYDRGFEDLPAVRPPVVREGGESAWHLYAIRLVPGALRVDRNGFLDELARRNVGASVHFVPVHRHTYYRRRYGLDPAAFPHAEAAFASLVSLPVYPRMTDGDVADVIAVVRAICEEFAA